MTELQACTHLVRLGHPAHALAIVAGMLEVFHAAAYIGEDERRAQEWLAHADPKRSYPPNLREAVRAVAKERDIPQEVAKREYDEIYAQLCMAKHANPMALGELDIVSEGDDVQVMVGPRWGPVGFACRTGGYLGGNSVRRADRTDLPPPSHTRNAAGVILP